jgi:hypothetical protein
MNRKRSAITLLGVILLLQHYSSAQSYSYKVDRAKLLFGLSSPGSGSMIMTFAATQDEGEDVAGVLKIIDLKTGISRSFEKLETFPLNASVSWVREGKEVVFESVEGIYQIRIDDANSAPVRRIAGRTHGLAFSPSESRMAYWKLNEGSLSLIVRDKSSGRVLHSWVLPFAYGGEASGFELAFVGEDRLYARTFDRSDATPLKEFDLLTGKVKTINPDCLSLASANDTLYFLAGEGAKGAIYTLEQGAAIHVSPAPFYTGMRIAGNQWITLSGTKRSAILDLRSKLLRYQTTCDEVTMIEPDTPVYEKGNRLSTDTALCSPSSTEAGLRTRYLRRSSKAGGPR